MEMNLVADIFIVLQSIAVIAFLAYLWRTSEKWLASWMVRRDAMTLRHEVAMRALQGMQLKHRGAYGVEEIAEGKHLVMPQKAAEAAFDYADAFIAAYEKTTPREMSESEKVVRRAHDLGGMEEVYS